MRRERAEMDDKSEATIPQSAFYNCQIGAVDGTHQVQDPPECTVSRWTCDEPLQEEEQMVNLLLDRDKDGFEYIATRQVHRKEQRENDDASFESW